MRSGKREFVSQEYSTEKGGKNLKEGTRRSRRATMFAAGFFSFAIIIGICLITFTVVFFYSEVKGTSMMRALNDNDPIADTDSVIVNRYKKPKRGDIIVVKHYDQNNKYKELHIKRLVSWGGESIHFRLVEIDSSGNEKDATVPIIGPAGKANLIFNPLNRYRYVIEVDGEPYESIHPKFQNLNGNNVANNISDYYNDFYIYQQTGNPQDSMDKDFGRRRYFDNPGFRFFYKDKNGAEIDFRQNTAPSGEPPRFELVLPKDYMFYMGDNRGGEGDAYDISIMSVDGAYFGPQPHSHLRGVVTEIVHDKSAPRWFWDKFILVITFGIVKK